MALAMFGIETARAQPRDRYTCCLYHCSSKGFIYDTTVCQAPGICPPPGGGCVLSRASTKGCTFMCQ
jgi:hypothetical protein